MIVRQAAFGGSEKLLKGNTHTHTTRSDGACTPEETIHIYAEKGYDFLALTDHSVYNFTNFAPESGVLILPGTERDDAFPDSVWPLVHCVHIVSIGSESGNGFAQDERFHHLGMQTAKDAQYLIDETRAGRNLPIFCHPEWSGNTVREIEALSDFSLMEIWNSGCVRCCDCDDQAAYWDELLCDGRVIYGVAADDAHSPEDMGVGYVCVRADKTVDSILNALKTGAFYSSTGPEIYDFYVEDGVAHVKCSPAAKICFRFFRSPYGVYHGEGLTEAKAKIVCGSTYIRAEVFDAEGRCAWTNPIFLSDGQPV